MQQFWYDHVEPKYSEEAEFCHMNTDSLIVYIKKKKIFIKTLPKILKIDLILQILNQIGQYIKENNEKSN